MGPYIWVEFPILTANNEVDIQATTSSYFRALNGSGGYVDFNIQLETLRIDPNLPDVKNAKIIDLASLPVDTLMAIMANGLSLNGSDRDAKFYDWKGLPRTGS
jgi:hypothetical protein